ncbi:MAG: RnfH family protein [Burkholderiales bacterium]|nr:RnfH family protein [Burkholderiales bacterium]MCE7877651.1 RnfH family protein [Betaproteobacteria bacterium PRO3]
MTSIRIAVAWASAAAQEVVDVTLPAGATVADAIAASDALVRAGVDAKIAGYAIFGQAARSDTPLRDGDRVEVTRPLVADPKALRRSRARDRPLAPARPRRLVGNRS